MTVLFHRSLFEACGGFDPEMDEQEDYDLWVRYAVWNGPFAYLQKTTALYRVPMYKETSSGRHNNLIDYRHLVHEKNGELEIKTTMGALSEEYSDIERRFDELTNIDGIDPMIVHDMVKRHKLLRLFIRCYYAFASRLTK